MVLKYVLIYSVVVTAAACRKKTSVPDVITERKVVEYMIAPANTDAAINLYLDSHFVSVPISGAMKNALFVFLPGSYRKPKEYKGIVQKASSLGYHALGLMYPNNKPVNPICSGTTDTTCHERARLEIIDGIDRHPSIDVNPANSVINRLVKLLKYLQVSQPSQNWGQFLSGDNIDWTKIVISGHSQGGITADVIGKFYPIKKVVSFSGVDFFQNDKIPDWEDRSANKEKYFSLFNPGDEQIPYNKAVIGWEHLGMFAYGGIVNVDSVSSPFSGSHTLITRINPDVPYVDKFHNSTAVDAYIPKDASGKYVLDKAWEYLLGD